MMIVKMKCEGCGHWYFPVGYEGCPKCGFGKMEVTMTSTSEGDVFTTIIIGQNENKTTYGL